MAAWVCVGDTESDDGAGVWAESAVGWGGCECYFIGGVRAICGWMDRWGAAAGTATDAEAVQGGGRRDAVISEFESIHLSFFRRHGPTAGIGLRVLPLLLVAMFPRLVSLAFIFLWFLSVSARPIPAQLDAPTTVHTVHTTQTSVLA